MSILWSQLSVRLVKIEEAEMMRLTFIRSESSESFSDEEGILFIAAFVCLSRYGVSLSLRCCRKLKVLRKEFLPVCFCN